MKLIAAFGLAVVAGLMMGGCVGARRGGDGIDGLAMASIVRLTYSKPTTPPTNPPHN